MKKLFYVMVVTVPVLLSCKNADQQAPEIARDFCNCFTSIDQSLSPQSKKVLKVAADGADYILAMQTEMSKLSEEDQLKVSTELEVFGEMDQPNSTVGKCLKKVEEKYKSAMTLNQEKFMDKVIVELEKQQCDVTASLMKVGRKMAK